MQRARRHQRLFAGLAFALLALIGARRPEPDVPASTSAATWPRRATRVPTTTRLLLAAVKLGVALLFARLAWRFVRAHAAARAGRRVDQAGLAARAGPRVRPDLLASAVAHRPPVTRSSYSVQQDAEQAAVGRWPRSRRGSTARRCYRSRVRCRARRPRLERSCVLAERLRAVREGNLRPGGADRHRLAAAAQPAHRDRRRASTQALRPRLREPTAARSRLARGQRPAPAGPVSMS